MKKIKVTLNLLVFAIMAATLMTSCGGGSNQKEIAKVKPETIEISGDLSGYLQIVDNEYELIDDFTYGNLSIKVKAIKAFTEDEMKDKHFDISASLLGDNGMPVSGSGEFTLQSTSEDKLISLLKKGSGEEVIQLKTEFGGYNDEEHAEKSKKFSVSSTMKEKDKSTASSNENTDNSSSSSDENTSTSSDETTSSSSSTNCDQFLADYEKFVNSYLKILKKYKANPTDASIMIEYTEMASKASTMQTDAANCSDAKYATKLMRLNTKIATAATGL